jgi:hypothetical protein
MPRLPLLALALPLLIATAPAVDEPLPPALGGRPAPQRGVAPVGVLPPELAAIAREVATRPLPERVDAISKALLGRPYLLDPLGEGAPPDPDPIARYDAFDCLTFTEEVLALALAGDPIDAGEVRRALRYGAADPSYAARRHFMELQWIPGNVADGWLRDTTAEYGPTFVIDREVTAETWARWKGRAAFRMPDEALPVGPMRLNVLTLDHARAAVDRFRPGSLLLTVRAERPNSPVQVSHIGIIVPGERPTVRHATPMGKGGVKDHGLAWYLDHMRTYAVWPAVGVAILEPIEQGPRR